MASKKQKRQWAKMRKAAKKCAGRTKGKFKKCMRKALKGR